MWLDQPRAKFNLKSYSNPLLINFFDPNSWNQIELSPQNQLNIVWFISKKLIYIKNSSNFIENVKKSVVFSWLNNWHLDGLFRSFNQKMIEIDWYGSILIKKEWNSSIIIKIWSKCDQNFDCWFDLIVKNRIGQKYTTEIGRFEIRIVDDLICNL